MRRFLPAISVFLVALILLPGCSSRVSVSECLNQKGIGAEAAGGVRAELRYLKESRGANYKSVGIEGSSELYARLMSAMEASESAEKPKGKVLPELDGDCEIVITAASGQAISFYYIAEGKLLANLEKTANKTGEVLQYKFFAASDDLVKFIEEQKQNAMLETEESVEPFRNPEELKASIDPDELSEEAAEIAFEFFTDDTPANTGTSCRLYTQQEFAAVPADSFLITAYGKSKTGEQLKLSILGMEANSYYTKVIVSEPDAALDSVDGEEAAPESNAITAKREAIDPGKWIVFVDEEDNVLDVLLLEDVGAYVPSASAGATDPGPTASASADDLPDGPGDESGD